MFTKEQIANMKEEEFQNKVLVPLFRAMKFQDVTVFGGGSLELGKDIVMWKQGDFGERENYGVVVKAVRISGKAKGKDSASEVLNQVRQCLTSEYPDPVTGQKQKIHRCFIVSSQIIEKSAINSIQSQLEAFHFEKLLRWIHPGTNLYQLIDEYIPIQNVFEKLSSVQKDLDESMKNVPYRIIANSDSHFSLVGKHEKAFEEMPIIVPFKLQFDTKTEEGKAGLEKWQNHLKKGTPVEIEGKFIEYFEFPEFFPSLLRPQLTKDTKLLLKHNPIDKKFPIKLHFESLDGQVSTLDYVELIVIQPGQEEITYSNENQAVPWKVILVMDIPNNKINFNYSYKLEGINVFQQLKCLEFMQALEKGGSMQIESLITGVTFPKSHLPPAKSKKVPGQYVPLLKELLNIQNKIFTPFSIGKNGVSEKEAQDIFAVSQVIETGVINLPIKFINTQYSINQAKQIIDSFKQRGKVKIIYKSLLSDELDILGNKINLGQYIFFSTAYLFEPTLEEIEKIFSESEETDIVEMKFKFQSETTPTYYLKWLSVEKLEELKLKTFPEIIQDYEFDTWITPDFEDESETSNARTEIG